MEFDNWSKSEKGIARRAFDAAYARECKAIENEVRKRMGNLREKNDLWKIHDYLSQQRRDIDRKYDYRYGVLIHVFGVLLYQGWITIEDLSGLSEEKIEAVRRLARMWAE
jgi:hypothetical protein